MKILGIHPTHTATAALIEDGALLGMISEERLNGIKEWHGIPKKAISYLLDSNNIKPEDIDVVAINGLSPTSNASDFINESFNIQMSGFGAFKSLMPSFLIKKNWWVRPAVKIAHVLRNKKEIYDYFKKIGINGDKIVFVDHHTCHAHTCFMNPEGKTDDMLIVTLDAAGDGYCGSVNVVKNNKLITIDRINVYNSLGLLYSRMTQYLNMKPLSHEYKVMGLAAYSKDKESDEVYRILRSKFMDLSKKNPLQFENLSGAVNWEYLDEFDNYFRRTRFDVLAGGVQKLVENLVTEWVLNCVKKTGIKNVFCAGGVFMNVKTNMLLAYRKEIDSLFIVPSCGDESCSMGAALFVYRNYCKRKGIKFNPQKLKDIYFGNDIKEEEILEAIKENKDKIEAKKVKNINEFTASLLSKGEIVARCSGKMEFGARALGNRSILAHPNKTGVIREINEAIKQRDFWMPFACTINDKYEKDYLINPKRVQSSHMMISFRTKEKAHEDLINGMHQYDLTARPQILKKEDNPDYYEIIEEFRKRTGIGGLLNTSFNIHGKPIVSTPSDAIDTLLKSGLKNLIIGNYYITKKKV